MIDGHRHRSLGGIVAALVTPFDPSGRPELGAIQPLVDSQIRSGIHGLFVAGTSGEGPLMSALERQQVTDATIEAVRGRVPVVVHCGAADTRTAADLAGHAESAGASAIAVVAPYFYAHASEAIYSHFARVAETAPSIPHYIYENPERTGYSIGVEAVLRLVGSVPNIRGVKDTGDSVGRLMMYLSLGDPAPEVFTGSNVLVHPALSIGAKGAVSTLANVAPELFVGLYRAFTEGRSEEALEYQKVIVRLQSCLAGLPYVPVIKYLLRLKSLPAGESRAPHLPLSEQQRGSLIDRINAVEQVSWWLFDAAVV
jgi:dihydrodipicolinate synthase/N-acetylneuraminate lyase